MIAAAGLFAACGADATRYAIGGTVSGLSGAGLVLANNGSNSLPVPASGSFTFSATVASGAPYAVTVQTHPEGQACTVTNGSGNVNAAAVTGVMVTCTAAAPMTLAAANPPNGTTDVARTISPAFAFSAAPASNPAGLTLQSPAGSTAVTASAAGNTLTVTPVRKLLPLTTYTLTATGVRGSNGEQLAGSAVTSFTTRDASWQAQQQFITGVPYLGFTTRVGMNANGNAVAVWLQNADSWTSHYSPTAGWGPAERLQANESDVPRQIVMDASGNAIGVWEDVDSFSCPNEDGCERHTLRVRRYTVNGGWGGSKNIASDSSGNYMQSRIAMNPAGAAVLVWNESESTRRLVWSKRYTTNGGWESSTAISAGTGTGFAPQLAMDESGNVVVVWEEFSDSRNNIWSSRYAVGSGWDTPVLVKTDDAGHGTLARIAMDSHGNALAVWRRTLGFESELWWNRYTPGAGWGTAAFVVNGTAFGVVLAMDASGNGLVIWSEYDTATPAENDSNIWSLRYAANAGWSPPVKIGTNARAITPEPLLAMDAAGNALAAWSQHDGTRYNAWSNRFTANGGWGTEALLENYDAGNAFITWLAVDASGDGLGLLEEFPGPTGSARVYTKRFE